MFNRHIRQFITVLLGLVSLTLAANSAVAKPTIEDYGYLADIRQVALSPKAERLATVTEVDGELSLIVMDLKTGELLDGTRLGKMKFRGMAYLNEDMILFHGGETMRLSNRIRKAEIGAKMVYNLKEDKTVILLGKEDRLQPFSSAGGTEKFDPKNELIFMSAREGLWGGLDNPVNLYRVDVNSGKGKRHKRGTPHTTGWFIGENNVVVGRTDYHSAKQEFRIVSYLTGKESIVYTAKRPRAIDIQSTLMSVDEKTVYVLDGDDYYSISLLDGSKGEIPGIKKGYTVAALISDGQGHLDGIAYDGTRPFADYFDPETNAAYLSFVDFFPQSQVSFTRARDNNQKVLGFVSGSDSSGDYYLFDKSKNTLATVASRYPRIKKAHIGEVQSIKYKARDGLDIEGVLTWPVGANTPESRKNLPLIVLPHGGPEAHDTIGFDWWSQFLASKGYLVLQPNFRGSTGFGKAFIEKGQGKWGKEMQDDVSDGVLKMISAGYADKDRVCIMGASYGGYAAMAGGAFTPELYRCVVAVAGVSDLERMLFETKLDAGKDHWIIRHWEKLMGKEKGGKARIQEVSPINSAENFRSPTLLIHGVNDTVVPISQSQIMHSALSAAGKDSTLVELEGEDHNLSFSKTRFQMLEEIAKFLDKHNPA